MAEPTLTFAFNHDGVDQPWSYDGYGGSPEVDGYKVLTPATDLLVFTGGGIDDSDIIHGGANALGNQTLTSGIRSATIRPSVAPYVIPYLYVESDYMYYAKLVGHNTNRYAMAINVKGTATSDLFLEAWDDNSFSTTNLEVLTGTPNSSNMSYVNAIKTTDSEPPWAPGWDGNSVNAAFLRGTSHRIGLGSGSPSSITDDNVYYNIYIKLETDCSTFHATPVLAVRYLYT